MPDRGIMPPPSQHHQHHNGHMWLPAAATPPALLTVANSTRPEALYSEVQQHQGHPFLSQYPQQPNVYHNFQYYASPPSSHQHAVSNYHDSPLTPISSNVIPSASSNAIKRTPSFPQAATFRPDIPRMIHTSMSVTPTGYNGFQSPTYNQGNPNHAVHSSSPPYHRRFTPPHPPVAYPPDPASSYHHHHVHHPYYLPPHHEGILPWSMSPSVSVEYISDITSQDVLSGRGGATNSWSGNRAFRKLVKEHQGQYLRAKKRDKPAVASIIVDLIRKRGGRFLRRANEKNAHHHHHGGGGGGQVLWVDIGDDRAREKTCQALREGAPALRRKNRGVQSNRSTSYEEDEEEEDDDDSDDNDDGETCKQQNGNCLHESRHLKHCHDTTTDQFSSPSSSSSTLRRTHSAGGATTGSSKSGDCKIRRWSAEEEFLGVHRPDESIAEVDYKNDPTRWMMTTMMADGPIYIRPWEKLMVKRDPMEPIDLDQLPMAERDTYLRDFFPPDPSCIRASTTNQTTTTNASVMTYDESLVDKSKQPNEFLKPSSSIDSHFPNQFIDDLEEDDDPFHIHNEHHHQEHHIDNTTHPLEQIDNGLPSPLMTN